MADGRNTAVPLPYRTGTSTLEAALNNVFYIIGVIVVIVVVLKVLGLI